MNSPIILELYIFNGAPDSQKALDVMKEVCKRLGEKCHFMVIDVHAEPEKALLAGILVTPTLIKRQPAPIKRVIGQLQNERQVSVTLGLEISA